MRLDWRTLGLLLVGTAASLAVAYAVSLGYEQSDRSSSAAVGETPRSHSRTSRSGAARRDARSSPDDEPARDPAQLRALFATGARTDHASARAAALRALYGTWDDELYAAAFIDGVEPAVLQEKLDWMRDELGECRQPVPMEENPNRFSFECDLGAFEAEFVSDEKTGALRALLLGSRDASPPGSVWEAAHLGLQALATWDEPLYDRVFGPDFLTPESKKEFVAVGSIVGVCKVGDVQIASARGAIFGVACERGNASSLKVELDDEGLIAVFLLDLEMPTTPTGT